MIMSVPAETQTNNKRSHKSLSPEPQLPVVRATLPPGQTGRLLERKVDKRDLQEGLKTKVSKADQEMALR